MHRLKLGLVPLFVLCLITGVGASLNSFDRHFDYFGQANENFELMRESVETRYRDEYQSRTCQRDVPYTDQVCRYETRYRQECHWEPGRRVCEQVPYSDRECRNVTRYRQECSRTPDRQRCRQVPGERVCRQQPPRRQCRTLPNGQQRCRDIPGREICRNKPGRQVCETIPGQRTCRQVPYTDRECRNVTRYRQECRTLPGQNVCQQVPYQENVCQNVTRYRTENYECGGTVQVPYTIINRFFAGVEFVDFRNSTVDEFAGQGTKFKTHLDEAGNVAVQTQFVPDANRPEIREVLVLAKKKEEIISQTGEETRKNVGFKINFLDFERSLSPILSDITRVTLSERELRFTIGEVFTQKNLMLKVKLMRGGQVVTDMELIPGSYRMNHLDRRTEIVVDTSAIGASSLRVGESIRGHLGVGLKFKGKVLNENVHSTEFNRNFDLVVAP